MIWEAELHTVAPPSKCYWRCFLINESDPGRENLILSARFRIRELVANLAPGEWIDPNNLIFKWDKEKLVLQEHGMSLNENVFNLRIYLGKKWRVLSFSESGLFTSVEDPVTFVSRYKDQVIAALKKLKTPEKGHARP
jgi:hypothetical protein